MSAFSDSCVLTALHASPAPVRGVEAAARRWRRIAVSVFDPYQPHLHYMRGPGPKWREKHRSGAKS